MTREVCEHQVPIFEHCNQCETHIYPKGQRVHLSKHELLQVLRLLSALREAATQALEAMLNFPDDISDEMFESIAALKAALAEPVREPVAFITPLMEQQMFDDWCPYKGSPDPRTVWAAAVDSVNGLLLGASPPQRKPLTEEEIKRLVSNDMVQFARAIERAHGIGGQP